MNTALQEAAQAAKEASLAKTVLLSHMSHDIRIPINGIMGMTDIAVRNLGDTGRMAGRARERGLSIKKEFSGVEQLELSGDELHLRQIIINILGNAVKFTPDDGEVVFIARGKDMGGGMSELTLIIQDNGIGMSEDFQQKIFEPFAQVEDSPKSRYKGIRLSMSIVRQFLDLMGGSIELKSAPGRRAFPTPPPDCQPRGLRTGR